MTLDRTRRQALLLAAGASGSLLAGGVVGRPGRISAEGLRQAHGVEGQRTADLGNGTYLNPVLAGDHPDPSVLRDGDLFYKVSSSFLHYPGLVLWRSGNLVDWVPVGPALREPIGSVYAPDLIKQGGRFYIYFAVRAHPLMPAPPGAPPRRPMTNYVIHADAIEGPWSAPIDIGIYNAIDPGHVVGEDGKRYLYVSDGVLVPLAEDGLSRVGPDQKLYDGWKYPADWQVETFALEGPTLLRRDGWFYLFSAEGGTAGPPTSHMVVVARSRSIKGPWQNCPHNPIVHTRSIAEPFWSRGHATAVEDAVGRWWLVYHGYENGFRTLGRQMLLEPMEWTGDGWPRALGGDLSRPRSLPQGPRGGQGVALSGPITPASFGPRLTFFCPQAGYMNRVEYNANGVILQAQGKGPADSSPLLIHSGDRGYELTVEFELGDGVMAGLLLFYNEKFFCGIASDAHRFHAFVLGAANPFEAQAMAVGKRLFLKLVYENQIGSFFYSPDAENWTLYRSCEVSGYQHNVAGGYSSLRPAIFASGAGSVGIRSLRYRAR